MSTVAVFGGAGNTGRYLVRFLLLGKHDELIKRVIIADTNVHNSKELVKEVDDTRCEFIKTDILVEAELSSVLEQSDIVVNMVGPYENFGTTVLEASIRQKCDYIDVSDETEPCLEALGLDALAKEHGVMAVMGIGGSPGLSNLLVKKCVTKFDNQQCTDALVSWGYGFDWETQTKPDSQKSYMNVLLKYTTVLSKVIAARAFFVAPIALSYHAVNILCTPAQVFRDKELQTLASMEKHRQLFFPGLDYTWNGYLMSHPENVVLHRSLGVESSASLIVMSDFEGKCAKKVKTELLRNHLGATSAALFFELDDTPPDGDCYLPFAGGIVAVCKGTVDGEQAVVGAAIKASRYKLRRTLDEDARDTSRMKNPKSHGEHYKEVAAVTAAPACTAVVMTMIKARKIGVFTPEQVWDADEFLEEYGKLYTPELKTSDIVEVRVEKGTDRVAQFSAKPSM